MVSTRKRRHTSGDSKVACEGKTVTDDASEEIHPSASTFTQDDEDNDDHDSPFIDHFRAHFFRELSDSEVHRLRQGEFVEQPVESITFGACRYERRITDSLSISTDGSFFDELQYRPPYKQRLLAHWDESSQLERSVCRLIAGYTDLYWPNRRSIHSESLMRAYAMHSINHVLRTRQTVLAHNAKLRELADHTDGAVNTPDEYRDQGLTRAKVLVLLPFRSRAYRFVQTLVDLLFDDQKPLVTNRKRFEKEFAVDPNEKEPRRTDLPADWRELFSGNVDDCFRLGVAVARKSLKLFVDFYAADLIIASPLGLRTALGAEGDAEYDFDFLSSVELLVLDEADVFVMQNWQHTLHILQHLHRKPVKSHGTDFSRVHLWQLNEFTKFYRQTLLFSSVGAPELRAVFSKFAFNHAGWVAVKSSIPENGVLPSISLSTSLTHSFRRFDCLRPSHAPDARFQFFVSEVLPKYLDGHIAHTLLVVPSYFDFVRLRNHFKRNTVSCVHCCEYSSHKKVARARALFYNGEKHVLMCTERWHFYRRYRLRGVHHVLFYELPFYARFYSELCTWPLTSTLTERPGTLVSVESLFCRYDVARLANIVGGRNANRFTRDHQQNTHVLLTN